MTMIEHLLLANSKVIITTNKEYQLGEMITELQSVEIDSGMTITLKPLYVSRVATRGEYVAQLAIIVPKGYKIAAIGFKKRYYEVKPDMFRYD